MSSDHSIDVSPSVLELLKLLWDWHWHNPVNLFEYHETTSGGRLSHPASRSSAPVSGDGVVALLERGWVRGGRELMLTNAGVAVCRKVNSPQAVGVRKQA